MILKHGYGVVKGRQTTKSWETFPYFRIFANACHIPCFPWPGKIARNRSGLEFFHTLPWGGALPKCIKRGREECFCFSKMAAPLTIHCSAALWSFFSPTFPCLWMTGTHILYKTTWAKTGRGLEQIFAQKLFRWVWLPLLASYVSVLAPTWNCKKLILDSRQSLTV